MKDLVYLGKRFRRHYVRISFQSKSGRIGPHIYRVRSLTSGKQETTFFFNLRFMYFAYTCESVDLEVYRNWIIRTHQ